METRLLIAYALIALIVLAIGRAFAVYRRRRSDHGRLTRSARKRRDTRAGK